MTSLAFSPTPVSASTSPAARGVYGPPSAVAGSSYGVPPTNPVPGSVPTVSATFVTDLTEASRLAAKAVEMLATVPQDDRGSQYTKDLRIRIFKTDMAAQKRLERQFDAMGNDAGVLSELRRADAYLEDANWQLAKKPSPDGRFNGVDVPGAMRDMSEGARIIAEVLRSAGGVPTEPSVPASPAPAPVPGSGTSVPPTTPPAPPTTPPAPPTTPPVPPTTPNGDPGQVDPDYPTDDEFPTDSDILAGGDS